MALKIDFRILKKLTGYYQIVKKYQKILLASRLLWWIFGFTFWKWEKDSLWLIWDCMKQRYQNRKHTGFGSHRSIKINCSPLFKRFFVKAVPTNPQPPVTKMAMIWLTSIATLIHSTVYIEYRWILSIRKILKKGNQFIGRKQKIFA